MKISNELYSKLKEPLPKEAVSQHPTKPYLSSIKAIYVTERLNTVFGAGSWQIRVEKQESGDKGMIVVKVTLTIPEYEVYYESFGGNDNGGEASKNFDLGDAFKGATTDAITKIGSYLGIGIDVFKGLQHGATQPKTESTQTKQEVAEWMTDKQFEGIKNSLMRSEEHTSELQSRLLKFPISYEIGRAHV
jgi:hypothetical protein